MVLMTVHGGEKSMRNWTTHHKGFIVEKNVLIFCLCPEVIWKAELKGGELVSLA
jgi:hypothetical protein